MTETPSPEGFNVGEWLHGTGADSDIAICTRVRFARNVKGFRFSPKMEFEEAKELTEYMRRQLTRPNFVEKLDVLDLEKLEELERHLLLERHLISRELASANRPRFVAVNEKESVSVMVNEEDHIRAQVFASGQAIDDAYRHAEEIDGALMRRVPIAYSEEFGFLTACPTNTGTGLRVSVMLHLPGLVWADEIEKAAHAAQKTNMAVRGLYGEGSRATGDFYQVSNQITLGRSEDEIVSDVREAVRKLVAWERKVRDALLKGEPRDRTLDRVHRALGTLERARILSTEEALTCLSAVRLGAEQGVLEEIEISKVNTALLLAQPAHLQRLCNETLSADDRDLRRASLMRKMLGRE